MSNYMFTEGWCIMDTKKKLKISDIVGICCGVFLVLVLILDCMLSGTGARAGLSNSKLPDGAQVLYGSAEGRNGPVEVKVVADANGIYQIKVVEHSETKSIGTVAAKVIPERIYEEQRLAVDACSGATITSEAIKEAVANALTTGGLDPYKFGLIAANEVANKVNIGTKVTLISASDWEEQYPEIYASYMADEENGELTDYLEDYPMLKVLYEGFGFAKDYKSARGHFYAVTDITNTGRPHALANCFTCKTPDFTVMTNEMGDAAYSLTFEDVMQSVNSAISCYNCHANDPTSITVTHNYLTEAMGDDFENVDAATLSCGQCHVEYYFAGDTKATTLPYTSLSTMNPFSMLAFYNENGFSDFVNPRTGVEQIKVQHPEMETFLGEGSQHRGKYTCADCHMSDATDASGNTYKSHQLTSPLNNEALIKSECSACHDNLVAEVKALQAGVEKRTNAVGEMLVELTEKLAVVVADGSMSDAELKEIRSLARDAQFYWDFVFVENSEGAHNSTLTYQCLDKAEELAIQALELLG